MNFIVFDFETTGLNPFYDKIIEYAFIQSIEHYVCNDTPAFWFG